MNPGRYIVCQEILEDILDHESDENPLRKKQRQAGDAEARVTSVSIDIGPKKVRIQNDNLTFEDQDFLEQKFS